FQGNDTLTVDNSNGIINVPITFDAGSDFDTLRLDGPTDTSDVPAPVGGATTGKIRLGEKEQTITASNIAFVENDLDNAQSTDLRRIGDALRDLAELQRRLALGQSIPILGTSLDSVLAGVEPAPAEIDDASAEPEGEGGGGEAPGLIRRIFEDNPNPVEL